MIEVDQTIIVRNCKIPVVNGHMRMQVDTFGKIEPSKVYYTLQIFIKYFKFIIFHISGLILK